MTDFVIFHNLIAGKNFAAQTDMHSPGFFSAYYVHACKNKLTTSYT